MSLSRRGMFGFLAGALAAPLLPTPTPAPDVVTRATFTFYPNAMNVSTSDIVTQTLRARGWMIADNLTRNNALLDRMRT